MCIRDRAEPVQDLPQRAGVGYYRLQLLARFVAPGLGSALIGEGGRAGEFAQAQQAPLGAQSPLRRVENLVGFKRPRMNDDETVCKQDGGHLRGVLDAQLHLDLARGVGLAVEMRRLHFTAR